MKLNTEEKLPIHDSTLFKAMWSGSSGSIAVSLSSLFISYLGLKRQHFFKPLTLPEKRKLEFNIMQWSLMISHPSWKS